MFEALKSRFQERLTQRRAQGLLRTLPVQNRLVDFCSNDYLGLARRGAVSNQQTVPFGSSGSRLISGNHALCEKLEEELARFHRAEAGVLFASGYTANLGLIGSIAQRGDTVIYDELSHASIHDALRLTLAEHCSFRHNNLEDLRSKLLSAKGQRFVVVEALYSVDGDYAPLSRLATLCTELDAALVVDEAHSTGIFGEQGEGLCIAEGIQNRTFARIHTFGKALGYHGAVAVGSTLLKDYLINFCRPFIFTTALPPRACLDIRSAYEAMKDCTAERAALFSLVRYFREVVPISLSSRLFDGVSPIQCVLIPGNEEVMSVSASLQESGFDVRGLRSPTVPRGRERLRICMHAFNSKEEVDGLIQALVSAVEIS